MLDMDLTTMLAYFVYNIMSTFAIERFMKGFFGDRRTSRHVMLLSYMAFSVVFALVYLFVGIPVVMMLNSFVMFLLLTLNYTAKPLKRIFVSIGIFAINFTIEGILALFLAVYMIDFFDPLEAVDAGATWGFVLMGIVVYLTSLIFLRLKNIRKNTITLPFTFWLASLLIPGASLVILIGTVMYMPRVIGILSAITLFMINMMVFYLHDTVSKVYEEKLVTKDRFLARMSHEMRTPVSAIMGISEIQLRNQQMPPHTEAAFANVYDSAKILLNVVADILDFSKIETEEMPVINAEYNVESLINDMAQLHLVYLECEAVKFRMIVDETLPVKLTGDVLRIRQIVNNLLTNAFKFTNEGTITLSLKCEKEQKGAVVVIISVQDTGIGMTPAQVKEAKNLQGGHVAGLGLPIVRNLAKMMNARFDIESEVGKGTNVIIRIPQEVSGAEVLGSELANRLQNLESNVPSIVKDPEFEQLPNGKVLVVDDMDINLYIAEAMLESFGLNIELCLSGKEAIDKIKQGKEYDIIFMDYMMPDMDGIETTKALRSIGYNHPIVALTANAVKGQAERLMDNGFSGFMSKPIDIKILNSYLIRFIRDKGSVG